MGDGRLFRALVLLGVVTGAAAAVACGRADASSIVGEPMCPYGTEDCPKTNQPTPAPSDSTHAMTTKVVPPGAFTNALCHVVNSDACMPDDDGEHHTANTKRCPPSTPAADAGDMTDAGDRADSGTASSAPSIQACRLARADGVIATNCSDGSRAGDGASCDTGADCAAGLDCVLGAGSGAAGVKKTCRHYCCAGTCKGHLSNGEETFCDVQPLADLNQRVPVCMPIKRCTLLGNECSTDESCGVVTDSGETGCVAIGGQQVGAACDEDHCAANLTCLGQPGSRKCYKLCKVGSSDCGSTQVCEPSTVFKDQSVGTCQGP